MPILYLDTKVSVTAYWTKQISQITKSLEGPVSEDRLDPECTESIWCKLLYWELFNRDGELQDLAKLGISTIKMDVRDLQNILQVVDDILKKHGHIDLLSCNAGKPHSLSKPPSLFMLKIRKRIMSSSLSLFVPENFIIFFFESICAYASTSKAKSDFLWLWYLFWLKEISIGYWTTWNCCQRASLFGFSAQREGQLSVY